MPINFQRLRSLIRKEVTQLLRDRRALAFMLGLPLLQLFLYAYAVNTTVYHIPMAVVDQSQDAKSRSFIQALVNSQYFNADMYLQSQNQVITAIDDGQVKAGLIIPPNFATNTDRGTANVMMLLDGSDSASVTSGYGSAGLIAQNFSLGLISEQIVRKTGRQTGAALSASSLPITTSERVLYNPDMIDIWFLLPGLVGMLLQTLAVQQAALIMVRDRELGTMEQILVTPARPLEIVVSKIIPLLALCLMAFAVIIGLGVFWFGVPFNGSLFLYFWLSFLFIASSLGLGMLVSVRAGTQRQAQQLALPIMMFGMLLSGMIYPRLGMPLIPSMLGDLLPLTYFIRISRGIFSRGVGMSFVWQDAAALGIYTVIVVFVAARNFKKRLD
ncbi:MAG: ABC transporter permease [Anaerolineaceae bacterium]|nr:ABC transporter permease [Anaerolineaceae bacterium]